VTISNYVSALSIITDSTRFDFHTTNVGTVTIYNEQNPEVNGSVTFMHHTEQGAFLLLESTVLHVRDGAGFWLATVNMGDIVCQPAIQ
jgi:hypothetical protein